MNFYKDNNVNMRGLEFSQLPCSSSSPKIPSSTFDAFVTSHCFPDNDDDIAEEIKDKNDLFNLTQTAQD